jgi:hypothetical protein
MNNMNANTVIEPPPKKPPLPKPPARQMSGVNLTSSTINKDSSSKEGGIGVDSKNDLDDVQQMKMKFNFNPNAAAYQTSKKKSSSRGGHFDSSAFYAKFPNCRELLGGGDKGDDNDDDDDFMTRKFGRHLSSELKDTVALLKMLRRKAMEAVEIVVEADAKWRAKLSVVLQSSLALLKVKQEREVRNK